MAPIKKDIDNLSNILRLFGDVTGLTTNFTKSSVVPIRCRGINLSSLLQNLPAARATFPLKYLGLPLSVWKLKAVDFQFLVDKVASKLVPWDGQNITSIGRATLVKSVLSSQSLYFITSLIVPSGTLRNVNKLERAFLWAGTDKTTGAKCKVNWDSMCRPLGFGGLGVLNTEKFARALRLRWLWFEWKEPSKMWIGLGNPCDEMDYNLFYASTNIAVGNGARTPFWDSPWVHDQKPKDIAPLLYASSMPHFRESIRLWATLRDIHLQEDMEDDIVRKHTANGAYSAASAYDAQFQGTIRSPLICTVWKACAPPKVKFFAWLANQNRIWTNDRLAKRGWENSGPCPLCKHALETVDHLLYKCRYTVRLREMIKGWLQLGHLDTSTWHLFQSTNDWWVSQSDNNIPNRKAMASLTRLISWTIWNERNARVFRQKSAPPMVLLSNIKVEAAVWVTAGAKHLGTMMPGE
nr:uncharacterized protein LOC109786280 [Aegilops tauschii subsp. strangulata]